MSSMPAALLRTDEEVPSHPIHADKNHEASSFSHTSIHSPESDENCQNLVNTVSVNDDKTTRKLLQLLTEENEDANNGPCHGSVALLNKRRRAFSDKKNYDSIECEHILRPRHKRCQSTNAFVCNASGDQRKTPQLWSPESLTLVESISLGSDNNSLEPVLEEEDQWFDECEHNVGSMGSPTAYFLDAMNHRRRPMSVLEDCDNTSAHEEASNTSLEKTVALPSPGSIGFDQIRINHDPLPILLESCESKEADLGSFAPSWSETPRIQNLNISVNRYSRKDIETRQDIPKTSSQFPFDEEWA